MISNMMPHYRKEDRAMRSVTYIITIARSKGGSRVLVWGGQVDARIEAPQAPNGGVVWGGASPSPLGI